jgi:hypothetical protein
VLSFALDKGKGKEEEEWTLYGAVKANVKT